jgi:hypothetical protein
LGQPTLLRPRRTDSPYGKSQVGEDICLLHAHGTELQNKSYETYECQKDPDTRIFTLRQTATRKYDITHKLEFSVNAEGLPEISDNGCRVSDVGYAKYANQINAQEIIPKLFGALTTMRACDFKQKAMRCFPEVNCETAFRILLTQAYQKGLIYKRKINENETYYDLCPPPTMQLPTEEVQSLF